MVAMLKASVAARLQDLAVMNSTVLGPSGKADKTAEILDIRPAGHETLAAKGDLFLATQSRRAS